MELTQRLKQFTEGIETGYLAGGILVLAALVLGMQLQSPSQAPAGDSIAVNLTVDKGDELVNRNVEVANNSTVFDALNSTFEVKHQEYSGMGYLVTSVDGREAGANYSWMYWVDGKMPDKAVNRHRLTGGENVTFRYLSNEEASKYFEN